MLGVRTDVARSDAWPRAPPRDSTDQPLSDVVPKTPLVLHARGSGTPFPPSSSFRALRSGLGKWMILRHDFFVERMLPRLVLRDPTDQQMERSRAPFLEPGEDRRPTFTWPRQVPIGGEPAETHPIVADIHAWFPETASIRKLWIDLSEGSSFPETGPTSRRRSPIRRALASRAPTSSRRIPPTRSAA